jgi:Holliday junction DNA helicase RuvB
MGKVNRPQTINDFIGNQEAIRNLKIVLESTKKSGRRFPNTMLYGNAGTGKTTLAQIVAEELGAELFQTTGNAIRTQMELFLFLGRAFDDMGEKPVVIFIDEIHALAKSKELDMSTWLPILEDGIFYHSLGGTITELNGKKYRAQEEPIELPPFTVIGATTDIADLDSALRRRFPISIYMHPYTEQDLSAITAFHAEKRGVKITATACMAIAKRGRFTPSTCISLLENCVHYSIAKDVGVVDDEVVRAQMEILEIDDMGLRWEDRLVLKALSDNEKGLGLSAMAGATGVSREIIENIIEPYLRQVGFIITTNKRFITEKGRNYVGICASH